MARTRVADPVQEFQYQVTIQDENNVDISGGVGFSTMSGLEGEVEVAEYREGGYSRTHKLPGLPDFGPVTLERGATSNIDIYEMFMEAVEGSNPDDSSGCGARTTVTIEETNCEGETVKTYRLYNAWASRFQGGEKDASSSEVSIEVVELEFEDWELVN